MERRRLLNWILVVIGVLMIPLISMLWSDQINWDVSDFIIVGAILVGIAIVYEVIIRKSAQVKYRVAVGIGLLGALLLFWVNGAVGIIGHEGQDANMLFGVLLVVGLVGALISRFRPRGMSITLYLVALLQILVTVAALIIWPPSQISWSPSVIGVFLLSSFFALLFVISGKLFRESSSNSIM